VEAMKFSPIRFWPLGAFVCALELGAIQQCAGETRRYSRTGETHPGRFGPPLCAARSGPIPSEVVNVSNGSQVAVNVINA
jgi:hypothetical protein